jgi:hypothetical protein
MSRLIVCERGGRWSAGLERLLPPATPRTSVGSLVLADEALQISPHAFVVIEVAEAELTKSGLWLAGLSSRFPRARAAAVGDLTMRACQGELLEAGAVCCLWGLRRLRQLAPVIERHLATAPRMPVALTDEILARLPWGDVELP